MAENNNYMEFVKQSDLDFLDQTAIEAELFQNEPSIQNVSNETNVSTEAIEIHDVLDTEEEDQDQEDDTDQGADPDADSGADPDADSEADTGEDPDPDPVVDPAVETDRYGNRYDDSDPGTDSDEDADPGAVTDMEQHQYVFDTVRGAQYIVQGTSDGRIEMFTLDREGNQTDPVLANDTEEPESVNSNEEPGSVNDNDNGEPGAVGVGANARASANSRAGAGANNNDNEEPGTENSSENSLATARDSLANVRDRLDLLKTTIRDRLDRWGETYDDQDPPSLAEITEREFNEMERQVDENRQRVFRDPSTLSSSSDEDEVEVIEMVEMPGNSDSATIDAEANPGLGIAEETPAEKSSEEAHNSEREMANISAWENRSASQKRYHAQKHYQEVRERGRRNRRLILRCMRYPGGQPTVVINRLPKQIREMAHLYPGFNPNAGRGRDGDEDDSEDGSDPPRK